MDPAEGPDPVAAAAAEAVARGDATGWFDPLYRAAGEDPSRIPWAALEPNRWVVEWLDRRPGPAPGSTAVVVGCGLGDDAEELARRGYEVVAFDVSETAVAWARRRFPDSSVTYRTADLFALPPSMEEAFDLVLEAYTLQSLPLGVRPTAVAAVASLVAPGGSLLVVCRAREEDQAVQGPPWPLSRADLAGLESAGLLLDELEDFLDPTGEVPIRRFRAHWVKPSA